MLGISVKSVRQQKAWDNLGWSLGGRPPFLPPPQAKSAWVFLFLGV